MSMECKQTDHELITLKTEQNLIWKIRDTIFRHVYGMQANGSRAYLPKGSVTV